MIIQYSFIFNSFETSKEEIENDVVQWKIPKQKQIELFIKFKYLQEKK